MSDKNPLLQPWSEHYGLPPFNQIKAEHFIPAFEFAFAEHLAEIEAIANNKEAASFANTVAALDKTGATLGRVANAFFNLTLALSTDELQAVESDIAPRFATHMNAMYLNTALFTRLDQLHAQRSSLGLSQLDQRLLERIHTDFVMSGAKLDQKSKERYGSVMERLASLTTSFGQFIMGDEAAWHLELKGEKDLAGLPQDLREAMAEAADQHGLGKETHAVILSPSIMEPFLTFSSRRDLREQAWKAWTSRGESSPERNTLPLIKEIMALRLEQAQLHGYKTYADYALFDRMAKTPVAVSTLLERIWEPTLEKVQQETGVLAAAAKKAGENGTIEPWDWRYWAEKIRVETYSLDDEEVKPYFQLDHMIEAMFYCAGRLFGLSFQEKQGIPLYHPDVKIFEVRDQASSELLGVFLSDNFARPYKQGGAWMSTFRDQSMDEHGKRVIPLVVNCNNFAKASQGQPTLLSFDDVSTLFHEFGHGLHGLLSNVAWERLASTNVLQDFVELPSQIYEHWALEPEVLKKFALNAAGEAIPDHLVQKIKASRLFNQGFLTMQLAGSALLDMALHQESSVDGLDVLAFEKKTLERLKVPRAVGVRHRLPHFRHLFTDSSYAAGYYVYLWAEVLEADGFQAFREAGSPFHPETAAKLKKHIYSAGNSADPAELYRAFRGRDPRVEALLADRGLLGS